MGKWVQEERVCSDNSDSDNEELGNAMYGHQQSKWLPRSLELLFGGWKEVDMDEQWKHDSQWQAYTKDEHLMEL